MPGPIASPRAILCPRRVASAPGRSPVAPTASNRQAAYRGALDGDVATGKAPGRPTHQTDQCVSRLYGRGIGTYKWIVAIAVGPPLTCGPSIWRLVMGRELTGRFWHRNKVNRQSAFAGPPSRREYPTLCLRCWPGTVY